MHSFNKECTKWFSNPLIQYSPPFLFSAFLRAVLSLLSTPWPTMCSASRRPACTEPDTSPSQTTLLTRQLWPLCRRTRWRPQRTEDTPATQCLRPSQPQPSSCPSTMSTRHIESEGQTYETSKIPCLWLNHQPNVCPIIQTHLLNSWTSKSSKGILSIYLENRNNDISYLSWSKYVLETRQPYDWLSYASLLSYNTHREQSNHWGNLPAPSSHDKH